MLSRKHLFFYKGIFIPSCFIVEGFQTFRFKTKGEIEKDILFIYKKLKKAIKKKQKYNITSYSTKSLSSFDYEIQEKGAIVDCNGGLHSTTQSYKNFLKDNDLVIKDWSDGSLTKQDFKGASRENIAQSLDKYLK